MLLITHIIIALSSIIYVTYKFFKPSRAGLKVSYALIGSTLISGTLLVTISHANIIQACTSGLLYLGFVSFGVVATKRQLERQHLDN